MATSMRSTRSSPARTISTHLRDSRGGAGWLVVIADRAPRRGERGAWLHAPDLDDMLRELLAPVLDERGRVRVGAPGELRLGCLYTYSPSLRTRLRGCARLVTIETYPERDTARAAARRAAADDSRVPGRDPVDPRVSASASPAARSRRSRPLLAWRSFGFVGTTVHRSDGRELFLYVAASEGQWIALAFEAQGGGSALAILADHAHQLVGQFSTAATAQWAAARFARGWLRGEKIEECGCGEIEAVDRP